MKKLGEMLLTLFQIVALALVWLVSDYLVQTFQFPMPANLLGLVLLLGLIFSKVVNVEWLRKGATWLLAEMLLFFVPAVVAVVNYQDLLQQEGIRIMAVLLVSTVLVIASTAWVVEKLYRFELKRARQKSNLNTVVNAHE
ncbi:CidA/LrgA family protein [Vibrio ziniensis]|uniref:CidA/LrgA family protein n=1 Tax=Vibrio ziniensis TaxID=2711221 RepID=A0A6G7CK19_9VIBR|nr:CidA/LrgA family protein [Vibrio ziniensis]QIH42396.1 CidA/LrgA family protein [Vibrio ziniensis]